MFVVLRLISLILVVSALMLLGADIVTSLETHVIIPRTVDQVIDLFGKGGSAALHGWCNGHLPSFLARGVDMLTSVWGWAATGLPGIVLAFLFGRRVADAG